MATEREGGPPAVRVEDSAAQAHHGAVQPLANIFQLRFLFLRFGPLSKNLEVETMSVQELRWHNRGYRRFVRDVLVALLRGEVYDDSDPDAYQGKADFHWYVPVRMVLLDGREIWPMSTTP